MESAGIYAAAAQTGRTPVLAIRGISDRIVDKSPQADVIWQPRAASNAAALAVALLVAADPADIRSEPLAPGPASPSAGELERIPPAARLAIEELAEKQPSLASQVARALSSFDDPCNKIRGLTTDEAVFVDADDPRPWIAAAEYAISHRCHELAAHAFEHAALLDADRPARWHARAALAYSAADLDDDASHEIAHALRLKASSGDRRLVTVIAAVIAQDNDQLLVAARGADFEDALVDLLQVQALAASGRLDDAIALARSSIERAPNRGVTGGLALLQARMLIARADSGSLSSGSAHDLAEAQELALRVRDVRRPWGGDSADPVSVAATAAIKAGDAELALRIATVEPDGVAIPLEADQSDVRTVAASAAMLLRRFDQARSLAEGITSEVDRLLVSVDCAIAEGTSSPDTVDLLIAALSDAAEADNLRVSLRLAELGVWPLPNLATVQDREAVEEITAASEMKRGAIDSAIDRLRALNTPRSRSMLTTFLVEAGRIDAAVDALRESAEKTWLAHVPVSSRGPTWNVGPI